MGLQTHFKGDTVETGLYVVYTHCLVTHANILYSIYSVYARVKTAQFTLLKGTRFSQFVFKHFLNLSITNRYKTQFSRHFQKYLLNSPSYQKFFYHSLFSPKALSTAERCCQKRGVKFSVIFVTVRFLIALSVFGENAESNFARSQTSCGVKLIVVGENGE